MKLLAELSLCGTTTWLPSGVESTADAVRDGRLRPDKAEELGVVSVPAAPPSLSPPDMAVRAARRALDLAGHDPESVGLLLHCCIWHQGHDMWSAPHYIARELGAANALPVTLTQGCNAMMPALELAAARLIAAPDVECALLTAADRFIKPGFDRWTGSYACAHGDGATATVLRRGHEPGRGLALRALNSLAVAELEEMNRAGLDLTPAPRWRSEDLDLRGTKKAYLDKYGFDTFEKLARNAIQDVIRQSLADADLAPDDPRIRCVTVPRMSTKLIETTYVPIVAEATAAPVLPLNTHTGHLSCGDVLANVADMSASHLRNPGDVGIVLNAGGGYTWSALVVEVPA